ncbi:hypothetical protein AB0J48_20405 [Nocardia salmonicida]|uniref:hypothetical protein n=1 Tax=Nocardia salmonicida TaxID=53431 RepID=UPI003423A753
MSALTRTQMMVLRNLAAYDALPCTVGELASAAKQSVSGVEGYLETLRRGQWVSRRGPLWQPTARGYALVNGEAPQ